MHRGPYGKYKSNVSEEVLLSTIHMCHNFAERTFPFLEFEREVLDVDLQQRMFWSSPFRPARTAPVASCKAAASPGRRSLAQGYGLVGIGLGRSSHVHGWHAAAAAGYGSGEATQ